MMYAPMTPLMAPVADIDLELPPSHRAVAEEIRRRLHSPVDPLPVIQLLGSDPVSKEHLAVRTAAGLGLSLYRMSADVVPAQWDDLGNLARFHRRPVEYKYLTRILHPGIEVSQALLLLVKRKTADHAAFTNHCL